MSGTSNPSNLSSNISSCIRKEVKCLKCEPKHQEKAEEKMKAKQEEKMWITMKQSIQRERMNIGGDVEGLNSNLLQTRCSKFIILKIWARYAPKESIALKRTIGCE